MNWRPLRIVSAITGGIIGFGFTLVVMLMIAIIDGATGAAWFAIFFPLALTAALIINAVASNITFARGGDVIASRAADFASGVLQGESAPARVKRVLPKHERVVATMSQAPYRAPARIIELCVLPSAAAPRIVHTYVPDSIPLSVNSPAAALLDPEHPDLALLDDRVSPDTLAAIAADPRWQTTRFPSLFAIQGGFLMLIALAVGGAVGIGVGFVVF